MDRPYLGKQEVDNTKWVNAPHLYIFCSVWVINTDAKDSKCFISWGLVFQSEETLPAPVSLFQET